MFTKVYRRNLMNKVQISLNSKNKTFTENNSVKRNDDGDRFDLSAGRAHGSGILLHQGSMKPEVIPNKQRSILRYLKGIFDSPKDDSVPLPAFPSRSTKCRDGAEGQEIGSSTDDLEEEEWSTDEEEGDSSPVATVVPVTLHSKATTSESILLRQNLDAKVEDEDQWEDVDGADESAASQLPKSMSLWRAVHLGKPWAIVSAVRKRNKKTGSRGVSKLALAFASEPTLQSAAINGRAEPKHCSSMQTTRHKNMRNLLPSAPCRRSVEMAVGDNAIQRKNSPATQASASFRCGERPPLPNDVPRATTSTIVDVGVTKETTAVSTSPQCRRHSITGASWKPAVDDEMTELSLHSWLEPSAPANTSAVASANDPIDDQSSGLTLLTRHPLLDVLVQNPVIATMIQQDQRVSQAIVSGMKRQLFSLSPPTDRSEDRSASPVSDNPAPVEPQMPVTPAPVSFVPVSSDSAGPPLTTPPPTAVLQLKKEDQEVACGVTFSALSLIDVIGDDDLTDNDFSMLKYLADRSSPDEQLSYTTTPRGRSPSVSDSCHSASVDDNDVSVLPDRRSAAELVAELFNRRWHDAAAQTAPFEATATEMVEAAAATCSGPTQEPCETVVGTAISMTDCLDVDLNEAQTEEEPFNMLERYDDLKMKKPGTIFCFGGITSNPAMTRTDSSSRIVIFDYNNNWQSVEGMPQPRYDSAACFFGDKIFVTGGCYTNRLPSNTCWIYCPHTRQWVVGPSMLSHRRLHALIANRTRLYALGGLAGDNVLGTMESFDARCSEWREMAPLPLAVAGAGAAVLEHKIYVCGGIALVKGGHVVKITDAIQIFNCRKSSWSLNDKPMQTRRALADLVNVKGTLYLVGGIDYHHSLRAADSVMTYDERGRIWKLGYQLRRRRFKSRAVYKEPYLYIIGGEKEFKGPAMTLVERLDCRTGQWSRNSLPYSLTGFCVV